MKKNKPQLENYTNTPHIRENRIIIFFIYFFSGVNFLVFGFIKKNTDYYLDFFIIGIMLLLVSIIDIFDNRFEMHGNFACVFLILVFIAAGTFLIVNTHIMIYFYLIEVSITILAVLVSVFIRKK